MTVEAGNAMPTIEAALSEFLDVERVRLAPRTFRNYEYVIELLRHCLNGYAHESLSELERKRWERAFQSGDEDAYCKLFGTDHIIPNLGEFLDYFMVRKVIAGQEVLRASGTVTRKLGKWLEGKGYISREDAQFAGDRGSAAARDLPRADKLGMLLFDVTREAPRITDPDAFDDADWIEDEVEIVHIDDGALWFGAGWMSASSNNEKIGPIEVPLKASELAEVGWTLYATLVRLDGRWHLLEVGCVYTR